MAEETKQPEEIQNVGTMLKNTRIKLGKTIADVSEELCIRKAYITAIEEMDYAHIPPVPYGVGFIRSYTRYLGLNSDRIISSYRQFMIEENEEKKTIKQESIETSKPHFKHIFIGLCGLAALFIIWSVMPVSEQVEDFRNDVATVIPEPVIIDSELDEASISQLRSEDEKDGEVITQENLDENALKEETAAEQSATDSAKENSTQISEIPSENSVDAPMKIVVSGPTWLELRQGKKILIVGNVYDNGFEYAVPNEKGLKITVGRPHNVKFLVKGEEIPVVSVMKRKNVSLDEFMPQEEQE